MLKSAAEKRAYNQAYYKKHGDRLRLNSLIYYHANRDEILARIHTRFSLDPDRPLHYALKRFGISAADYNRLHDNQGGVCASCKKPETSKRRGGVGFKRLAVDHNHATGTVRALLCAACNQALGLLKEDPDRIKSLLEYLTHHA